MVNDKQSEPASLPLTQRAAYFHSLRFHLEIIKETKLDVDCGLDLCNWGLQRCGDVLKPIKMNLPPVPDFLLHVIRCNCKTTSKNTCGSIGFKCMPPYGDCRGMNCKNIEEERIGKLNDIDDDGNIFEKLFEL